MTQPIIDIRELIRIRNTYPNNTQFQQDITSVIMQYLPIIQLLICRKVCKALKMSAESELLKRIPQPYKINEIGDNRKQIDCCGRPNKFRSSNAGCSEVVRIQRTLGTVTHHSNVSHDALPAMHVIKEYIDCDEKEREVNGDCENEVIADNQILQRIQHIIRDNNSYDIFQYAIIKNYQEMLQVKAKGFTMVKHNNEPPPDDELDAMI